MHIPLKLERGGHDAYDLAIFIQAERVFEQATKNVQTQTTGMYPKKS